MKIVKVDYIITCSEYFKILKNSAICFNQQILQIDSFETLKEKYPNAEVYECGENSVLMPGLVNTHMHLEFSANKTTLTYGDFIDWLNSVIGKRDELITKCDETCISDTLDNILKSGTTTIGAISSFGLDLIPCAKSRLNVVYFNEVLGSQPAAVDALYSDFLHRYESSKQYKSQTFAPSISVHSPYSTHPILAKKVLEIAKQEGLIVSTHFMESRAEKEWLETSGGGFKAFFDKFMPGSKSVNRSLEYIELFKGVDTLFTHAVWADEEELEKISKIGSVTHCPVSNRLLNNSILDLQKAEDAGCSVNMGTDGLSSNISLNLWDELRSALLMHTEIEPNLLARKLLTYATKNGADALKINSGEIVVGKDADIIVVTLPDIIEDEENLPLQTILHTKNAKNIFIKGNEI